MSDTPDIDFRAKFLKVLGYSAIALAMGAIFWVVLTLGYGLFRDAQRVRCRSNFARILSAFEVYNNKYGRVLPPHFYALKVVADCPDAIFQCPADPDKGRRGCRPEWLRKDDGDLFKYTELDGPGLNPAHATDRLPSSYLYIANGYPCGLPDAQFRITWREHFGYLVEDFGDGVPMVRCYYHLPENDFVTDPDDPAAPFVNPKSSPTFNITADRQFREYQYDWRTDPDRKTAP
jgi:hypothetical protein